MAWMVSADIRRVRVHLCRPDETLKAVMPPVAAMYWSCLPTGSTQLVQFYVARLLGHSPVEMNFFGGRCKVFSRAW